MDAQEARDLFWEKFDEYVEEHGNEFTVCHTKGFKNQAAGNINNDYPLAMKTICCEFLYLRREILVQVYINQDIRLFDCLYARKQKIEDELGYAVEWITEGKRSPTVRRIQKRFPVSMYPASFDRVIPMVYPFILDFIRVFTKYL